MPRLLSLGWPLLAGVLLLAGSASALTIQYNMTGSTMEQDNTGAGGSCSPCVVPVTGGLILTDDELGNVTITNMMMAHGPYEVGTPGIVSVVIERTHITLGSGPIAGTGSTLSSNALFGTTTIAQQGSITCTPIIVSCALAGLPAGTSPLVAGLPGIDIGTFIFDGLSNLSASIVYTDQSGAIETLNLVGTASVFVPEPGTVLLMAGGLMGLALRRRAQA